MQHVANRLPLQFVDKKMNVFKTNNRVQIGPLNLDPVTIQDAVRFVAERLKTSDPTVNVIATVNAQFVCIGSTMRRFASFICKADLVVADGMSVVIASRLLGAPLPERVAGVDLVVRMCEEAARSHKSVYFLGGLPGMARKAALKIRARLPDLMIAGTDCPPQGFEVDLAEDSRVFDRILSASPDILFVGLGAPKQEYWIENHLAAIPAKIVIGVGGSFEMLAGNVPRAPHWLQALGLEWAFRFAIEPRRLWKRYLIGNFQFLNIIVHQLFIQQGLS